MEYTKSEFIKYKDKNFVVFSVNIMQKKKQKWSLEKRNYIPT